MPTHLHLRKRGCTHATHHDHHGKRGSDERIRDHSQLFQCAFVYDMMAFGTLHDCGTVCFEEHERKSMKFALAATVNLLPEFGRRLVRFSVSVSSAESPIADVTHSMQLTGG